MGCLAKKFGNFFLSSTPLTKTTVLAKRIGNFFSSHYPLDKRSRFERKKIKKALGKFPKAVDFFTFS